MPSNPQIKIIGELINNAYARARRAWEARDLSDFQHLARLQDEGGAAVINLNIDGTQSVSVSTAEMLEFLPKLIPAIQEVSDICLSFDNPNIEYHKVALKAYDPSKARGKAVLNSLAASRRDLNAMVELIREHDMRCIVMASEKFLPGGGSAQCMDPKDSHATILQFVDLLASKADRKLDDIIIDPGLAPVGADTYGLVNIGLDTMRLCQEDPNLEGIHFSVGLSNFAWGTPNSLKAKLERAYLTIAARYGLDMALANVEKNATPLPAAEPLVSALERALKEGRRQGDESIEEAGFRQAEAIMELCNEYRSNEA